MPRYYSSLAQVPRRVHRTPSDLKWLLNERAAACGEQGVLHKRIAQLRVRLAKLEALRRKLTEDLESRQGRFDEVSKLVAALDVTLTAAHPSANPEAGGTVNSWAGRYGARGSLRTFLVNRLRASGSTGVSTTELIEGAIRRFRLNVSIPSERASIRNSVRTILKTLLKNEIADVSTSMQANGHPLNHWRLRSAPTLADLYALASKINEGQGAAHDLGPSHPNPA